MLVGFVGYSGFPSQKKLKRKKTSFTRVVNSIEEKVTLVL